MSELQYIRYCANTQVERQYYMDCAYPHPYLLIWVDCKRNGNSMTGAPSLPEPERGVLDQDAELMLAFDVLDHLQSKREEEKELRKKAADAATSYFNPSSPT